MRGPLVATAAVCLALPLAGCLSFGGKSASFRTSGSGGLEVGSSATEQTGPASPASDGGLAAMGQLRLSDRFYVASLLGQVYATDPATNGILKTLVTLQIPLLGGACDPYQNDCASSSQTQTGMIPTMNPARGSLITRACDNLNADDASVKRAVAALDGGPFTTDHAPDVDAAAAVFAAFHPQIEAPAAVASGLASVAAAAAGKGYAALDQWRFLLLTVCLAPDWQAP
jgi:hypothetical protein